MVLASGWQVAARFRVLTLLYSVVFVRVPNKHFGHLQIHRLLLHMSPYDIVNHLLIFFAALHPQ